ncbi:MAG: YkoF family thiamine/hydroxymethylpyrimidine-binding protein [Sedimentibacter sp.]|uniref:YkoF family thiamine/hydroxymethylpyrimidine-binding protein n=1 Tax=Sedimentibacter sp. TaxID=1960295 RepID=UPI002980B97E|nr:YkoF family thiamine/hydroxymethylpyrimidine-binding protein [Sedimentibacter sp.]MDW5299313.1 YkoF family thiamine/hydroxymethylpyrimidine-binding protein [Sedimentibacter sp.]
MCNVEKIASCQIAFTPIVSDDYIDDVKRVLDIINNSGLENSVGVLSTFVRGEKNKVLKLIADIYEAMDGETKFSMDIKISNLCGCGK